jgi:hypothetical protein
MRLLPADGPQALVEVHVICMLKITIYIASGLVYTILFVEYAREPIRELLSVRSQLLVDLIFCLCFLPVISFGALAIDAYKKSKQIYGPKLRAAQISSFKKLRTGKMLMQYAFWGYHIPVTVFFSLIGNYAISRFWVGGSGRSVLILVFFFIICLGYHILTILGTWRSSRQYSGLKIWVVLARVGVILSSICTALTLILGLRRMYAAF